MFFEKEIRRKIFVAALAFCVASVGGCGDAGSDKNGARDGRVSANAGADFSTKFPVACGEKILHLRLALTELERRQGLTGVRLEDAGDGAGMIFVYADSASRAFWMRGVPVGLSVGFFDANGKLLETREMAANDTATTRSRSSAVKFVVEMPARWFEKNGVAPGARLDLHALEKAVHARGFLSENFALGGSEN